MNRPDPLPLLAQVADAGTAAEQPNATLAALDRALGAAIGHKLFTVLVVNQARREAQRYYSNQPQAYPVGGAKPMTDTEWSRQVIGAGRPWIGKDYRDVTWAFFDHELIRSLGCESAINIPVRWGGRTLGTLNLLHQAHWYGEADAGIGLLFAALAVPAMQRIVAAM